MPSRRIQVRRDTETNWRNANPVLAAGEIGFDLTNKALKVGDGITHWIDLGYTSESSLPAVRLEYGDENTFNTNFDLQRDTN